jgi:hypothetical protein
VNIGGPWGAVKGSCVQTVRFVYTSGPTATDAGVQWDKSGHSPKKVRCENLTTRQIINEQTSDTAWDYEALGLVVTPGDRIEMSVRCSGLQTVSDGLVNNIGFEPTLAANMRGFGPTLAENERRFIATSS